MHGLEGANCADLPGFVVDKYFNINSLHDTFAARVGMAICDSCVVQVECRTAALTMPHLPEHGVIGGVTVTEIRRARAWREYEIGRRATVPRRSRPGWLAYVEAASAEAAE